MPARMPIGVAMSVATPTIITLPTMALARPPAEPGGGVVCRNSDGAIAPMPFAKSTTRIQIRNTMPNAIVASDISRLNRFTISRRR